MYIYGCVCVCVCERALLHVYMTFLNNLLRVNGCVIVAKAMVLATPPHHLHYISLFGSFLRLGRQSVNHTHLHYNPPTPKKEKKLKYGGQ